jgi:hypothetical protein
MEAPICGCAMRDGGRCPTGSSIMTAPTDRMAVLGFSGL